MALSSSYEIYKQGTSQVVSWLGKTAARCGYEAFATAVTAQSKKNSHKSNQLNRDNANNQSAKRNLSTKDLPVLAKFISEHFQGTSDFDALPHILGVLEDVISRRKQWGKRFQLPDPAAVASNTRHKHFVTVLEEVHQILGGVMSALHMSKVQKPVGEGEYTQSVDERALNNMFAVLNIEESTDREESVAVSAKGQSTFKPATVTYELEDEVDEEEVYFRIYCFFRDFAELRTQMSQSWADYMSGIVDLAPVAVTTNVYLQTLQRAETELLKSLPNRFGLSNYHKVAGLLNMAVAITRGVDSSFRQQEGDVINMELKDIADFTCLPVYIILNSFLPVLDGQHVPIMKPGFFGKVDLTGRRLSWREKFNQDKIVLLEFLPDLCLLEKLRIKIPLLDELSHGLVDMIRTKNIPMWLVLGCQVYLDIHHTMLSGIGMAQKQLLTLGLHISKTLQEYADFSKAMSVETWPKENDQFLQMLKLEADLWVNKDTLSTAQKKIFKSQGLPESNIKPYSLFSRQPILCGLFLFRLNMRMQEAGSILVNAWGSLPSVMHLYNAIKQESPKDDFPLWEDVEAVIQIQGKDRVFVGDYPKSVNECFKRFCLVMGYSASIFAPNRREGRNTPQTQTPASKRGPREMTTTSAVSDVFRGEYCDGDEKSKATLQKIETLLNKSTTLDKDPQTSKNRPYQVTMSSLLSALQKRIQADILALNIDYFALHMRCIDLLRDIYIKLDADFRKFLGPGYLEKENQLPFLVGYLIMIATNSAKIAESQKLVGPNEVVKSATLLKAADIVQELVEKKGNKEVERVRTICRGFDWLE